MTASRPSNSRKENDMKRYLLSALAIGALALVGTVSSPAWAAGDAAAGKDKAGACAMCHGPNGEGTAMGTKLAGEDSAKFVQALQDYKSGKRDNAMMKGQAAGLSDADMANLAAYYATLK
jgi:cytochrome c553